MDFLDPKKKQKYQIKLFIGYGLMAVLIGIVTVILAFLTFGYNVNLKTGDITQNGMLFVDAHPQTASVIINGVNKGQTDQRLMLPAGNYDVVLKRDGYRTWTKKISMEGGRIIRLVYPFLFPEKLVSAEDLLLAGQPPIVSQSPDHRWLLAQKPGDYLGYNLIDLNGSVAVAADLTLPKGLLVNTGHSHNIKIVEWSSDNRHVVLKHSYDKGFEFVLLDIEQPSLTVNLSKKFNSSFTDVSLKNKSFNNYYLFDRPTQSLKTASINSDSVNVILSNVLEYKSYGNDTILYATNEGATSGHVLIKVKDGDKINTVRDFPAGTSYLLDITRFDNKWYIAAGAVSEEKIYVLRNPMDFVRKDPNAKIIPAATLRIKNAGHISFSTNSRIIAVQAGADFAVYDAETDRNYKYKVESDNPAVMAEWMDGHRLSVVKNGKIVIFDFDGTNTQVLSSSFAGLEPYFNKDYKILYSIASSVAVKGRAALYRTSLIVQPGQ